MKVYVIEKTWNIPCLETFQFKLHRFGDVPVEIMEISKAYFDERVSEEDYNMRHRLKVLW